MITQSLQVILRLYQSPGATPYCRFALLIGCVFLQRKFWLASMLTRALQRSMATKCAAACCSLLTELQWQVFVADRAVRALTRGYNLVDLSRRSFT